MSEKVLIITIIKILEVSQIRSVILVARPHLKETGFIIMFDTAECVPVQLEL